MQLRSGTTIRSGGPLPQHLIGCSSKVEYQFKLEFYHFYERFETSLNSNDKNKKILAAANLLRTLIKPKFRPFVRQGENLRLRMAALKKCDEFMDSADRHYATGEITRESYEYLQDVVVDVEMAYKNYI